MASENSFSVPRGQQRKHGADNSSEEQYLAPAKVAKIVTEDGIVQLNGNQKTYKDLLPLGNDESVTDEFISNIVSVLQEYIHASNDKSEKVVDFKPPEELAQLVDFNLKPNSISLDELVELCRMVLQYCVKTGHPRFFNQMFQGLDVPCLMGSWISATANCSMYTYEVAPSFVLVENAVLNRMRQCVGFPNGEGIFFPGGSVSNMQSMSLARFKAYPSIKEEGVFGLPRLVAFCSEESHYSNLKAVSTLGLGTNSLRKVKTDKRGKMLVHDLERQIQESLAKGEKPFYVCATGGTTVVGAFDPLEEISDVCERFGLWMHVDAAWGASVLVSEKHKHLMKGVERADSVTWNPHKMLGCLLQCSALLIRERGLLQECNKANASYLFQKDKKSYDVKWDTGDRTIQCGRPSDVFKLWVMWKAKGDKGLEAQIDKAFYNARYLADQVKKRANFELLYEPECVNVCFRYLAPSVRDLPDGKERDEKLHKIPPEIKRRMTTKGSMLIGYQPLKHRPNFFRMIVVSPALSERDMDFVLDEIERLGADL